MPFLEKLSEIQNSLRENRFPNESSISTGIVLPILQELGWQVFNPRQVLPEYNEHGGRVDYALFDHRERVVIFIEVKMLGNTEGAEQQLFNYAFHQGVPFLILTDGREWNFFLPLEQGNYLDRKLYKLDLLERNSQTILDKFNRYLLFDRVDQGVALEEAKSDFREISRRRDAERFIPQAWRSLIVNKNDTLLTLLIDNVEGLCGLRPERESCENFLNNLYLGQNNLPEPRVPRQVITNQPQSIIQNRITHQVGYMYNGHFIPGSSARNVLIGILKILNERDPSFLERFYASLPGGNHRRIISRNINELYPTNPELSTESREFLPGWWIGLNYSRKSIERIILQALSFAGLRRNVDIEFNI
jgi:hypothetical protein